MAEQQTEPTERELLAGIYTAVSTIRTIVVLMFLAGIALGVLALAQAMD